MKKRTERSLKQSRLTPKLKPPPEIVGLPKISAQLLDFAKPLLELLPPSQPLDQFKRALSLAEFCWNLPILSLHAAKLPARLQEQSNLLATFQQHLANEPPFVQQILTSLL